MQSRYTGPVSQCGAECRPKVCVGERRSPFSRGCNVPASRSSGTRVVQQHDRILSDSWPSSRAETDFRDVTPISSVSSGHADQTLRPLVG